jgi:hypothetical protein
MLLSIALLLPLTGCPKVDVENMAQVVSDAEVTGNLTVFLYFAANKQDMKNAPKYLDTIEILEATVLRPPTDGKFISLVGLVHRKLEAQLVGEDAAFLPGAKNLSRILLMEMDRKLKLPKIELSDEAEAMMDIVRAFLRGAKMSLQDFIPT